jgi:methionyl-tRNA formyltransferase
MPKPTFAYFGSFDRSAEILSYILEGGYVPALVICSPDRPAGRKKILTPPAVKQLILEKNWNIPLVQPEQPNDVIPQLKTLNADFFIVMGYPHIIGKEILDLPRLGTIGIHPSLLPKYRGASPMQSVLLNGEKETGVSVYLMDPKMDHGPLLAVRAFEIAPDETNVSLGHKAARVAGELVVETLPKFMAGEITPQEQDHHQATFTKKFTTADGQVDMIKDSPEDIYRKIRAFNPEPSVWTMNFPGREGKRVKLLGAQMREGKLAVTEIQPDGKKPIKL